MRFLASMVMRGRSQAVMWAAALAMLSLVFPLISILSSAVVALVTLRRGPREGALLMVLAGAACTILAYLALNQAVLAAGFVLVMWFPIWLLAVVLRASRSMAVALQAGLVLGLLAIVWQFLQHDDPVAAWSEMLQPIISSMVESQMLDQAHEQDFLSLMSYWAARLVGFGFFLQTWVSLLVGRWWQSALYNPGGFRSEFHELRLNKVLAIVTVALMLPNLMGGESSWTFLDSIVWLLLAGWFLAGLATVHGVVGLIGGNVFWLVGVYMLLLITMINTMMVLATVAFFDTWFDFRARLRSRIGSGRAD